MIEQIWSDAPLWVVWMVQFLVIELRALFNKKPGDTLSEVIRYIFGFSKRSGELQSTGMKLRRGSFYALTAVLVWHFTQ